MVDAPPPLAGREMDARDVAFVASAVRGVRISKVIGYDEALSAGLTEYWRAAERFNESCGVPWHVFAGQRIAGAIHDEWRRGDYLTRDHRAAVKAGEDDATVPLHLDGPWRGATDEDDDHLADFLEAPGDGDHALRLTVEDALEAVHRRHPRAAAVLRLYYQQGWIDTEIAALFNVHHTRIEQLRKKGHELLVGLLTRDLLDAA